MNFVYSIIISLIALTVHVVDSNKVRRSDYRLWQRSESIEQWLGPKYFEQVSEAYWLETLNGKVQYKFRFIAREADEVILEREDKAFYVKLGHRFARWGVTLDAISNIYSRGDWTCM